MDRWRDWLGVAAPAPLAGARRLRAVGRDLSAAAAQSADGGRAGGRRADHRGGVAAARRSTSAPAPAGICRCWPQPARALVVGVDLSLAMLGRTLPDGRRVCARRLPAAVSRRQLRSRLLVADGRRHRRSRRRGFAKRRACSRPADTSSTRTSIRRGRARLAPHVPRRATGRQFELSYFPHTIDEHLAALERRGARGADDSRAAASTAGAPRSSWSFTRSSASPVTSLSCWR